MKRKFTSEYLQELADKYTPSNVRINYSASLSECYVWLKNPPYEYKIIAPQVTDLITFVGFLHECGHVKLRHIDTKGKNLKFQQECECWNWVEQILRKEGLYTIRAKHFINDCLDSYRINL